MRTGRLLVTIFVVTFGFVSAFAQNDPTLDTGFKPYGSYQGGDLDSVNLSNGNLVVHIPLAGYPQRGSLGYTPHDERHGIVFSWVQRFHTVDQVLHGPNRVYKQFPGQRLLQR